MNEVRCAYCHKEMLDDDSFVRLNYGKGVIHTPSCASPGKRWVKDGK
jgi:hypothetical protein